MPDTDSGIVYHYCSLEAFKSIIENECLWLCDVEKSNDYGERIYFEEIMLEQIETSIKYLKRKKDAQKKRALQALQLVKEALYPSKTERAPVYSCSFSYNGDQLSQWRGYADNGYGVAIGFYSDLLSRLLPDETFRRINYSPFMIRIKCKDILNSAFDYCEKNVNTENISNFCSTFGMIVLSQVDRNCFFFKSHAFSEEKECRIAVHVHYRNYSVQNHSFSLSPDKIPQSACGPNLELSSEKFRVAQRKLSSYVELSFSNAKEVIAKITLGPKCLAEEKDIRYFLECHNYKVESIQISSSESTYR